MCLLKCKLLISSLLIILATCQVSSQLENPQLKLNATVSINENLLSFVLICHYQYIDQTAEEIRRHREANVLSFQLNGTTILPNNDHGLKNYREWDFESGAMAECVLPKSELFIGIFSCKSMTETSSVVEVISLPEKTSLATVHAIGAVCSVLVVCTCIVLLFLVYLLRYIHQKRMKPKKSLKSYYQPRTRNVSFINNRSSLTSTDLETGQQERISGFPHLKTSSEDTDYINSPEEITLDSRGGRYRNEDHDIELHVPEFAVPNGQQITVKIAVSLFCPFQLTDGLRPVSPIVEFCVIDNPCFKFVKPVKIVLPHYLTVTSSQNDLQFVKAGHDDNEFKQSDGEAVFEAGSSYGTLLTNHFCHFCIASGVTSPSKANFRLIKITPKNPSLTWRVQYCVTYFLQTCLTSLKNSYDAKQYDVTSLKRFVLLDTQAVLQIHFERRLAGGWLLAQDGGSSKVTESEVDFWSLDLQELKQMEEEELYPPRFFIKVNGRQATDQATAVIRFTGTQGDLETELSLEPFTYPTAPQALPTSISLPNVHHFERPHLQPRYRLPNPALPSHCLLMNYVAAAIPAKWRAVGTQLNLSIGRLDQIEHDYSKADRCFSEVFALWERQADDAAPYQWSSLYEALRSRQVSENKLANDVEYIISATNSNTSLPLGAEDIELDG